MTVPGRMVNGVASIPEVPKLRQVLLFYFCFFIAWALKEISFSTFQEPITLSIVIKYTVWVLPVFLLLKRQNLKSLTYLKIRDNVGGGIKWGLSISLVLVLLEGVLVFIFHGKIKLDLGIQWVTTLVFALPEEVIFRGYILQKLAVSIRFAKANLYTSLLFVSIHFPIWYVQGITMPKLVFSVLTVFIVGFGLGYLIKKSNSLWAPVIVHTVYNLILYTRA